MGRHGSGAYNFWLGMKIRRECNAFLRNVVLQDGTKDMWQWHLVLSQNTQYAVHSFTYRQLITILLLNLQISFGIKLLL